MKNQITILLAIILSGTILFGCSSSEENKIAGTWQVEDVQFETSVPMDSTQLESSKASAKSVSYELLEDKNAKVHAGKTLLEGTWIYRETESGVYMIFTGSFDTVLLGRYEDGKLINIANRPEMQITTIFTKEK